MGAYGVSVEKEFQFRGQAERVTNVYHYRITAPVVSDYINLLAAVVARDKLAHTSGFSYKLGRVWGPTEAPQSETLMHLVSDLSGTGSRNALGPSCYRELTAVTQIFVGRSPVHNRKVFVRKYIRLSSMHVSTDDAVSGLLAGATRTFFSNWMDGNKTVTNDGVSFDMVTPRDRLVPQGNAADTLQYARIRQIHQ